jgi:hypothetical protein
VKRSTAFVIWSDLASLIYASISHPMDGLALMPKSSVEQAEQMHVDTADTDTTTKSPNHWKLHAYKVVTYCLSNALAINDKDWK